MGSAQSSLAKGHSKEEQKVISTMQVIGERGLKPQKMNHHDSKENLEINTFVKIDQFGETMTDTESESEYFSSEESSIEEDTHRALILEDTERLKALAIAFNHPEIRVTSTSPTVFGRNYFSRPSAIDQEEVDDAEERAQLLADAAALKKLATDYLHPEVGVSFTSPTVFGRNYFSRLSAIDQEEVDDAEERAQVLADAAALKKLAVAYHHPEIRVTSTSPTVFGRNYFSRPSAIDQEEVDDAEERAQVLADAAALKKIASDYLHPEVGVPSTSPTVFGRNYFSRPSVIDQEEVDDAEERVQILADAAALKKLATDYLHPEVGVSSTSPTVFGRNYFSRPSAIDQEEVDDAEERAQVLADAAALKKLASDYLHPEVGVSFTSPTVFGRNYFSRPSTIDQDDYAEERTQLLADAAALKKLAVAYHHPEIRVTSTSPTLIGRNYFTRPSAIDQEDVDDAEERAQVLADAAALKKLASDYLHPEVGVSSTSPTVFGRNYFSMLTVRKPLPVARKIASTTKNADQKLILKSISSSDVSQKKLAEIDPCNVKRSPSSVIFIGLGDDDGSAY